MENVGGNYSKLDIRWYTGQRFYAHYGYGGFRFKEIQTGATIFSVNEGDTNVRVANTLFVNGDVRSPIYYDSNDTAYYLNPAGGSRLRNLYVGDSGDDWSDPGGWGTQVRFSNGPHVKFVLHARTPGIEAGMYVHTPGSVFIGSYTSHDVSLMFGGTRKMGFNASYIYTDVYLEAAGSLRAPIFYDSQNTGYYCDPNSTSRLNAIVYDNLYFAGDQTYGFLGRNVYADTVNGRGSDPLELNYYDGGAVKIGSGANGSKDLYAGALYDAGNRVWSPMVVI